MAEINPPLYLDQDEAYGADELGLPYRDIMGEGVVGIDDLEVTDGGSLKSSVAAGAAWIAGDDDPDAQPCYRVRNDAPVLLQHDAADATNDRIDLVIALIEDATFSGVSKDWKLTLVKGTAAATPVAPDLPSNAIALAEVTIPAGSGTLGTITDKRTRAKVGGGAAQANSSPDGWNDLSGVFTLTTNDQPTFVLATPDDWSGTLSPGMRLKWEQSDGAGGSLGVNYAIVTAVDATTLTIFTGTDYAVQATGTKPILYVQYSREKAPHGFPLNPQKWTVELVDSVNHSQGPVTSGQHYAMGSLDVPEGVWDLSLDASVLYQWTSVASGTTQANCYAGLSTSSTGYSDGELEVFHEAWRYSANSGAAQSETLAGHLVDKVVSFAAKTTVYLIIKWENAANSNGNDFTIWGGVTPTVIRAVSAYL